MTFEDDVMIRTKEPKLQGKIGLGIKFKRAS
jgi:hypothetical protein